MGIQSTTSTNCEGCIIKYDEVIQYNKIPFAVLNNNYASSIDKYAVIVKRLFLENIMRIC